MQVAHRLVTLTHTDPHITDTNIRRLQNCQGLKQSMQQSTVWFLDDVESCLLPGRVLLSVSGHSSGLLALHGGAHRCFFTLQIHLAEDRLKQLSQHESTSRGEIRGMHS